VKAGELGLMEALDDLVQRTRALGGPECFFECPEPVSITNGQIAGHLFRIAQEAINNALKHSGATRIIVSLLLEHDAVRLSISDNGRGFPGAAPAPGLGLTVMQHRANILAAGLRIETSPEGGVVVTCHVPLRSS
jgi:signal transduction histidine kinase